MSYRYQMNDELIWTMFIDIAGWSF